MNMMLRRNVTGEKKRDKKEKRDKGRGNNYKRFIPQPVDLPNDDACQALILFWRCRVV
jgi:hypothetical protein